MIAQEFDDYREHYGKMSTVEMMGWHSRLYKDHPNQSHFNKDALLEFFSEMVDPISVFEIGGWNGEAAAVVLSAFPSIKWWTNFEVCSEAASDSVCQDGRYMVVKLPTYTARAVHTLVLSHSLEHMNDAQVKRLIETTECANVYVDCPITPTGETWDGTTCFHCLQMGWDELHGLFLKAGFTKSGGSGEQIRWYKR